MTKNVEKHFFMTDYIITNVRGKEREKEDKPNKIGIEK